MTTAIYKRERPTKNKVRYEPTVDEPGLGIVYVDKALAAELGNPELLRISIEAADSGSEHGYLREARA